MFGTDDRAAGKTQFWREKNAQCADQIHIVEQSTASLGSGLKMWRENFLSATTHRLLSIIDFFLPAG